MTPHRFVSADGSGRCRTAGCDQGPYDFVHEPGWMRSVPFVSREDDMRYESPVASGSNGPQEVDETEAVIWPV